MSSLQELVNVLQAEMEGLRHDAFALHEKELKALMAEMQAVKDDVGALPVDAIDEHTALEKEEMFESRAKNFQAKAAKLLQEEASSGTLITALAKISRRAGGRTRQGCGARHSLGRSACGFVCRARQGS